MKYLVAMALFSVLAWAWYTAVNRPTLELTASYVSIAGICLALLCFCTGGIMGAWLCAPASRPRRR